MLAYFLRPKINKRNAKADSSLESVPARVKGRRCIAVGVFDICYQSGHILVSKPAPKPNIPTILVCILHDGSGHPFAGLTKSVATVLRQRTRAFGHLCSSTKDFIE